VLSTIFAALPTIPVLSVMAAALLSALPTSSALPAVLSTAMPTSPTTIYAV
jgi:hypothetical protein